MPNISSVKLRSLSSETAYSVHMCTGKCADIYFKIIPKMVCVNLNLPFFLFLKLSRDVNNVCLVTLSFLVARYPLCLKCQPEHFSIFTNSSWVIRFENNLNIFRISYIRLKGNINYI